jgi:uncharacterized protein (DUF488 family)
MKKTVFTVGHSTHTIEYFLELLTAHSINCIVDVRSVAASKYNPQFNQEPLSNFLKKQGVNYLHFDKEFGARYTDKALLDDNDTVDFEKVRATDSFKTGVERLDKGLNRGYKIALMCSEAEPFDCHRFGMISGFLTENDFDVQHILKDKSLKTNAELEKQLMKKYAKKIPIPNLLEPDITPDMQLKAAYKLRNKDIGFSPQKTDESEEND